MVFEWNEAKNLENIRKHKIGFADVSKMFDGSMLIELDDRFYRIISSALFQHVR